MLKTKNEYIKFFRENARSRLTELSYLKIDLKDKSSEINRKINGLKETEIENILAISKNENWKNIDILIELMIVTYSSYVVMLEYRNKLWPYDYMSFARRIGELWEPFCKLAFKYSVKELKIVAPPKFIEIQTSIQKDTIDFINALTIDEETKAELISKYQIPWKFVDSGEINMGLDLHFVQKGITYNCDFKSGFSSNEKGNTNRLLLVASIYRALGEKNKQILFVRQNEFENNHYLQILKKSECWDVFCAEECYAAIKDITGFDIKNWLFNNANWFDDISPEFKEYLEQKDLIKYLTW